MYPNEAVHAYALEVRWSRALFDTLRDGGTWGVPRSGLVFRRLGSELHLVLRMPFGPEIAQAAQAGADVPTDADALARYQDLDLEQIGQRFTDAGVRVVDATQGGKGCTP